MIKKPGYLVKTKTGKHGRTYHCEKEVNGKIVVHIHNDDETVKILCDPHTIKIIGFID